MTPLSITDLSARRILRASFTLGFIILIVYYVGFQSRNLLGGPHITLTEPTTSVQQYPTVTLQGTTRNITHLSLNGKQIYTDEAGAFSYELVLENGYTIMTLYATDRFGRETSLSRPFVYVPASTIN